ncbi:MAG: terminase family protein [Candidatus Woesearchaeota archaeon]
MNSKIKKNFNAEEKILKNMLGINQYYRKGQRYKPMIGDNTMSMLDIDRLQNVYEILEQSIDSFDDELINLLMQHYENDIDKLFEDVVDEVYKILYGRDKVSGVRPTIRYFNEIDKEIEEQMRINSLAYFCSNTIGMIMNWHHLEWAWLVENFPLLAILAARDHGKSYFFSNAYPLWMVYRYDKNSNLQSRRNGKLGYIFSHTLPQAIELLDIIKDNVEEIDILREKLYPNYRENWSKVSVKFKNGCKIRVRGMLSSIRGAHPGYIVLDDVIKDDSIYSKIKRERTKTYVASAILGMLVPGGQMISVGTPFHYADLYSMFAESKDFVLRKYPAIDKDGNLLWPERHDKKDLEMRRRISGKVVFTREYLVEPISEDTSMFPESILRNSIVGMNSYSYVNNIEAFPIKFKRVIFGGDFALSARVGADFVSFVTFGVDDNENFWLLNLFHEKGVSYTEQKNVLKSIWRRFKPDIMYLEANQFQRIYSEELKNETSMPVKPFITTKRKNSLDEGVPALSVLFENGKIKFPYATENDKKITDMILDEFRSIGWTEKGIEGIGEHDDIVMSIWIARNAYLNKGSFTYDFI